MSSFFINNLFNKHAFYPRGQRWNKIYEVSNFDLECLLDKYNPFPQGLKVPLTMCARVTELRTKFANRYPRPDVKEDVCVDQKWMDSQTAFVVDAMQKEFGEWAFDLYGRGLGLYY